MLSLFGIFNLVSIVSIGYVGAYNILVVPMHLQASHKKSMVPLADALGKKGHYIKIWNPFFVKQPIKSDYVMDDDLVVKTDNVAYLEEFVWKNSTAGIDAWNSVLGDPWDFQSLWNLNSEICSLALRHSPEVIDKLLAEKWDLIIVDMFFAPCGLVLIERSGVPFISMTTNLIPPTSALHYGIPVQDMGSMATDQSFDGRSFWGRLSTFLTWIALERLVQAVFAESAIHNHLRPFVSEHFTYESLDSEASMVLSTTPNAIDFPRAGLPIFHRVGGPKCTAPKILPADWLEFLEDASSNGTILAAFGHVVTWRTTPMHSIMAFHKAFRRLSNYRIVWQYDGPELPKLSNVRVTNWLPQTDLLAHSSMVLFISHAGMKSSMEGICAKVPFLTIPIYADQPENSRMLTFRHKLGFSMNKYDFTAVEIEEKALRILTNPEFKRKVTKLSDIVVTDGPVDGLQLGVFASEFTVRHQHQMQLLQSKSKSISFIKYYYLDFVAVALPGGFAISMLIRYMLFLVTYPGLT